MKDKKGTITIGSTGPESFLLEPGISQGLMDIVHYKIEPSFNCPDGYTEGNAPISEVIGKAREAIARDYEVLLLDGKGTPRKYRLQRSQSQIFRKELNL